MGLRRLHRAEIYDLLSLRFVPEHIPMTSNRDVLRFRFCHKSVENVARPRIAEGRQNYFGGAS
jgi:hypothetical protein